MEFNATPQTAIDLERVILGLKHKKDALVIKKIGTQNELSQLRQQRDGLNINSDEAKKITRKRAGLKIIASEFEIEIKDINTEVKNKRMLLLEVNNYLKSIKAENKVNKELIKLRDKYSNFAGDHTRVSIMRLMAKNLEIEKLRQIATILNC